MQLLPVPLDSTKSSLRFLSVPILDNNGIGRLDASAARAHYTGANRPGRRPARTVNTLGAITSAKIAGQAGR